MSDNYPYSLLRTPPDSWAKPSRPAVPDLEWFPDGTGAFAPRVLTSDEIAAVEAYLNALLLLASTTTPDSE